MGGHLTFGKTMKTFADNLLALDSSQSLRLGLRAVALPSLRRFFGLGCVLGLQLNARASLEFFAFADSSPLCFAACASTEASLDISSSDPLRIIREETEQGAPSNR